MAAEINPQIPGESRFKALMQRIDAFERGEVPDEETQPPAVEARPRARTTSPPPPYKSDAVFEPPSANAAHNTDVAPVASQPVKRAGIWQAIVRFWNAFKDIAILFSLTVNMVLVVVVIALGVFLFDLKQTIADPLVSGLYDGFGEMSDATIRRTIPVQADVPVGFDLPINQPTTVVLTEPVTLAGMPTTMSLGQFGQINGAVTLVLPAGTRLPIQLEMTVPVETSIPIDLQVDAVIPLDETELNVPFVQFQSLLAPYAYWLNELPNSWDEALPR